MYSAKKEKCITQEFTRLKDVTYLDHAGSTLYAESQIEAVTKDLCNNVYGNPHSLSLTSRFSTDVIDQVRYRVLQHFNTNSNEYSVIFTSGATSALKLVAESFDWKGDNIPKITFVPQHNNFVDHNIENEINISRNHEHSTFSKSDKRPGCFLYLQDNHTSVLGMRELAAEKGIQGATLSHDDAFEIFSDEEHNDIFLDAVEDIAEDPKITTGIPDGNSLFVYPAQCNFSGLKYPLSWISKTQNGALNEVVNTSRTGRDSNLKSKWFCLLDAASFAATNNLDLSRVKPDFVCLSFYKMFGYPTGLGALLVKNSSSHALKKIYFGGGTVLISLSSEPFHVPRPVISDRFEDGTLPFLCIISLCHGFDTLQRLTGGMAQVSGHTFSLARYLHHSLVTLHHSNGSPATVVYCDTLYEHIANQGAIVNFNLLRHNGDYIGFAEVLNMANLYGIQLRTGCFCNPGACQRLLELSVEDLKHHFEAGHVCGDDRDLVNGQPTGSIRISFGYMSVRSDVTKVLDMIVMCFVHGPPVYKVPQCWPSLVQTYKKKFPDYEDVGPSCLRSYCEPWQHSPAEHNSNLKNKLPDKEEFNREVQETHGRSWERIISNINRSLKTDAASVAECHLGTIRDDTGDIPEGAMVLERLFLYPVKSCGALEASSWTVGPRGLLFDREWMVVTSAGVSLTQKQETKLCLVKPTIDFATWQLHLDFPGLPQVSVPLEATGGLTTESSLCQSKVCGDPIQGVDCGEEVAGWLSDALCRDGLRLIRQQKDHRRLGKVRSNPSVEAGEAKPVLSLSNQAQFLMLNKSSIEWLGNQMETDSDCSKESLLARFRCNLVVRGALPLVETEWNQLQIGNIKFKSVGPCTRCQMICIDQSTGERSREPLRTLAATFHGKMKFGVYLTHQNEEEIMIKLGDEVLVMSNT